MWNDTEIPLAVFFTFRCYGTWLHGDERGSVDRHHNTYGSPRISANDNWKRHNQAQLDRRPVELNAQQRRAVEQGVREVCKSRGWQICAINIRTNHVHAVLCIGEKDSARALANLKAAATKRLREERLWNNEETPWAEKGSRRKLWNERSVCRSGGLRHHPAGRRTAQLRLVVMKSEKKPVTTFPVLTSLLCGTHLLNGAVGVRGQNRERSDRVNERSETLTASCRLEKNPALK